MDNPWDTWEIIRPLGKVCDSVYNQDSSLCEGVKPTLEVYG